MRAPAAGLEFCGTEGSLTISRKGFVVTPDPKIPPEHAVPQFGGAHPSAGRPRRAIDRRLAMDEAGRGPLRRRVRPVPPPRPQLPRLRPVAQRARLGPGERPSRRDRLPPGEPLAAARPQAALGRRARDDRRRRRGRGAARAALPGPVGRREESPAGGDMSHANRRDVRCWPPAWRPCRPWPLAVRPQAARPALWDSSSTRSPCAWPPTDRRPPGTDFADPIRFLDYCRSLGVARRAGRPRGP